MLNTAWCDSNSKWDILKLHVMCPNPKSKRQKHISFSPRQFQLEGAGFEKKYKKT